AGVASRRAAEELIVAGRVKVNGVVVRTLGTTVEDDADISVDGRKVKLVAEHRYIILNKPISVMTTLRDPEGRRTVRDLLGNDVPRVVPVGRLDYDTSGLLLLTNDGELAHILTHPRFGVEKTYRAVVRGRLTPEQVAALRAGVKLDDGKAGPAQIRV